MIYGSDLGEESHGLLPSPATRDFSKIAPGLTEQRDSLHHVRPQKRQKAAYRQGQG